MKIRIGIDIQSIDEIATSMADFGDRYLERVYTRPELEACFVDQRSTAAGLADRFAAKEAVMKVLDVSDAPMPWKAIEIQTNSAGRYAISLSGVAAQCATGQGVETLSVSFSHTHEFSTAIVMGEFNEPAFEGCEVQ